MAERQKDTNRKSGVGILSLEYHDDLTRLITQAPRKPRRFKVLLYNDDYTPVEFVVTLIEKIFHRNLDDAVMLSMRIHERGIGVVGLYTREVAETKCIQARQIAERAGHPLMSSIVPE